MAATASLGRHPWLRASLAVSLAEQQFAAGNLAAAGASLSQARAALARHEMGQGLVGLRHQYLTARVAFASGDSRQGGSVLAAALVGQRSASPRLLQIGLAEGFLRSGSLTERLLDQLYSRVLRDPDAFDWETEPLDALAVLSTPQGLAYEHWFELALARKELDKALEIADRWRRHRFLVTQALGGRLVALRWLLGSPETSLPPAARLQRQQWLLRYPQFVTLERASAELRSRLEAALPAGVFSAERLNAARPLWDEWNTLVHAQEALLAQMALERLPTAMMFPPVLSTREAQQQLPEGTLVLYYQATSRQIYRFALDKDRYGMAPPLAFGPVEETVARLLRQIGNHDRNQPVAAEDLRATEWQKTGAQLMAVLTDDVASDVWAPYRELVIVPDGVVWYVPWEMLPPPGDTRSAHVISRWPVRQAPSLGLALPPREAPPPLVRTGIVVGRLSPRDEESLGIGGAPAKADS
jgi:hypothetical protein